MAKLFAKKSEEAIVVETKRIIVDGEEKVETTMPDGSKTVTTI